MKHNTRTLKKGISSLEKKICLQIDKIDATLDRSIKNVINELGRLRELHQTLLLKKEVLHRSSARKSASE
jgi:hypothetical protein